MFKSIAAVALALLFAVGALSIGVASADEMSGKVQSVNAGERMFTLEDGTQLWLAEGVSGDSVKEGVSVKASYTERDGKKIVTELEVGN